MNQIIIAITTLIKYGKTIMALPNEVKVAILIIIALSAGIYCFMKWYNSYIKEKEEEKKHQRKMEEMDKRHNQRMEQMANKHEMDIETIIVKEEIKTAKKEKTQQTVKKEDETVYSETTTFNGDENSSTNEINYYLVGPLFPKKGITLLAGEKGLGKTGILMDGMFQLAGVQGCKLFPENTNGSSSQFVIYYDYELTMSQFKNRYKNLKIDTNKFQWCHPQNNTPEYLLKQIEHDLDNITGKDATIVVDNITKVNGLNCDRKAKIFYNGLEKIRDNYSQKGMAISFIIVTHVELKRKEYHPVTKGDIKGASAFINYADSVILIGKSCYNESVLLKIENNRNGYESNGKAYLFNRLGDPYLHYKYIGEFNETELLPKKNKITYPISKLNDRIDCRGQEEVSNIINSIDHKNKRNKITKEVCMAILEERKKGKSKNEASAKFGVSRQAYNKSLIKYKLVDNYPIERATPEQSHSSY